LYAVKALALFPKNVLESVSKQPERLKHIVSGC
jgi:hypothetical protein